MNTQPPPPPVDDRAAHAVQSLDALAWSLRFVVAPALAVVTVLAVLPGSARPAAQVTLAAGSGVVAAVVLATALGACAAALRAVAAQAEATARLDRRLADGLERVAAAVESAVAAAPGASGAADLKARDLGEARRAIRAGEWAAAAGLVRDFNDAHPGDPEASRLGVELDAARGSAGAELRAKVQAAREVNDPERVLDLRDELKPLLPPDDLRALDRDLAKWLLTAIHRRLRAGTVRPDVAALAARVAGGLDETPEGASLRASLPTLRRAAGLCPRCGQPYAGIADACPACHAGTAAPAPHAPPAVAPDDTPDPDDAEAPPLDLEQSPFLE